MSIIVGQLALTPLESSMNFRSSIALAALLLAIPLSCGAVFVSADGLGQALIYPYYTAQSSGGSAYNTLFSIVNHTADAKSVRIRFREARNSRPVAEFNVFLSPHDVWTAGVIPTASGARLITHDVSCTAAGARFDGGRLLERLVHGGAIGRERRRPRPHAGRFHRGDRDGDAHRRVRHGGDP
jgi:hypothetical protein